MIKNKKIVCLSPHPDDVEFGCGGSLSRWAGNNEIFYFVFSPCNKSLPKGYAENSIYQECDEATHLLGIKKKNVRKFDFPVREFPAHRQAILEELVKINRSISPDLILMPNGRDVHQDHHQIYLEGKRAFKNASILGYELPWNNFSSGGNFFVKLNDKEVELKISAIHAYASQQNRFYFQKHNIKSFLAYRGMQVQSAYAECFETIRWVM